MYKYWNILFLTACLTLQLVASLPPKTPKTLSDKLESHEDAGEEKVKGQINLLRAQLSCNALNLLTNQSRSILRLSKPFLKSLVNELNSLPVKSAEMEKYQQRLAEALKGIEKINLDAEPPQLVDIFSSVDEVTTIIKDYANMPQNEEHLKLEKLLEKIGSKILVNKLNETLEYTLKEFKKIFEHYEVSLSDEKGKGIDDQLTNWLERFKEEDDTEKKIEQLFEIFKNF
uniref:Uncharacterized protein n=1 Tax=Ceratitis capitata TaxID=7213 RepID=W8B044_CERCA